MICVLIIYTPTSKPNNVCLILTHLFKETKVGKLNFTSVCRLYIPPSSLLPPPSSLLPPPSSLLFPPPSFLLPHPSSLLTPHSSLLTTHSSLLLPPPRGHCTEDAPLPRLLRLLPPPRNCNCGGKRRRPRLGVLTGLASWGKGCRQSSRRHWGDMFILHPR